MAIFRPGRPGIDVAGEGAEMARNAPGGKITAIVSATALLFSGLSLYQSVVKQPDLHVYVPPVMHLGRDETGKLETISIPITISNRGAREGTVLSVDLVVKNQSGEKSRTFYSAYFGSWPKAGIEPFAPIAVPGRSSYSGTVQFYPKDEGKNIVLDKGAYDMTMVLNTRFDDSLGMIDEIWRPETKPLRFSMALPELPFQEMLRGAVVRMHNPDWTTTTGAIGSR